MEVSRPTSALEPVTICLSRFGELRKDEKGGYVIRCPSFRTQDGLKNSDEDGPEQAFTWVSRDMGPIVCALLKNYKTNGSEVFGKTFYAVTARVPYERLARALSTCAYRYHLAASTA